jgi:hypothetical protein
MARKAPNSSPRTRLLDILQVQQYFFLFEGKAHLKFLYSRQLPSRLPSSGMIGSRVSSQLSS